MGKALGSWSGMKKYLEQDMLAHCLKGRVSYNCTKLVGMDGSGIFEVVVDHDYKKQFSMETVATGAYPQGKAMDNQAYWRGYWQEKDGMPMEGRDEFDDMEFSSALAQYRSMQIQDAILSIHPIVRMFAILDRRVGKRTLIKLAEAIDQQPEWLQFFYKLRMSAENIC